jgi:predicted DNA-binding transcriptional regulator AlpA
MDPLISEKETALMLGIHPGTLANWRSEGKGPEFVKLGDSPRAAVRYRLTVVQDWIAGNTK